MGSGTVRGVCVCVCVDDGSVRGVSVDSGSVRYVCG